MRTVSILFVAILLTSGFARGNDIDIGAVDRKPPSKKEVEAFKGDDKSAVVGLNETIKGKVAKDEKKHVYIIVNPLTLPHSWWVQQDVMRDGDSFTADAQFGEDDAGKDEFFAILAIVTDKKWSVGEKLEALPDDATYSKVKIVKRK